MILALAGKLVGPKLAPFVVYGTVIILALVFLWWLRYDAYHDGVRATDAKWEAANQAFQNKALKEAAEADSRADARAIDYLEAETKLKEQLDEAERAGSSPLDVLFK